MIKEKLGRNSEDIFIYQKLSDDRKLEFSGEFILMFQQYANNNDVNMSEVDFDLKLINEILIRVSMREDYYIGLHNETYMSKVRKSAIIAFWILKFRPFLVVSDEGRDYDLNINCEFAIYIIFCAVSEDIERKYEGKKSFFVDEDYLGKLKYAFKCWDLNEEALMLLAETLCRCVEDKQ